jgi:hypothetical protein
LNVILKKPEPFQSLIKHTKASTVMCRASEASKASISVQHSSNIKELSPLSKPKSLLNPSRKEDYPEQLNRAVDIQEHPTECSRLASQVKRDSKAQEHSKCSTIVVSKNQLQDSDIAKSKNIERAEGLSCSQSRDVSESPTSIPSPLYVFQLEEEPRQLKQAIKAREHLNEHSPSSNKLDIQVQTEPSIETAPES